jgi:hypothetical protein
LVDVVTIVVVIVLVLFLFSREEYQIVEKALNIDAVTVMGLTFNVVMALAMLLMAFWCNEAAKKCLMGNIGIV